MQREQGHFLDEESMTGFFTIQAASFLLVQLESIEFIGSNTV